MSGSPFYIDVFDIHKIRVNNFYNGNVNETAGFKGKRDDIEWWKEEGGRGTRK